MDGKQAISRVKSQTDEQPFDAVLMVLRSRSSQLPRLADRG